MPVDPVDLTARLIRCPSVTPEEGGALDLLAELLSGGRVQTAPASTAAATRNLFARWGAKGADRSFGFNGHTDVVPVGDPRGLDRTIPSAREIEDGILWGRGADRHEIRRRRLRRRGHGFRAPTRPRTAP